MTRRTKIVATIGPSSTSEEQLAGLFQAGADVFRFNFSHGTHAEHVERLKEVVAEITLRNRVHKRSLTGAGEEDAS